MAADPFTRSSSSTPPMATVLRCATSEPAQQRPQRGDRLPGALASQSVGPAADYAVAALASTRVASQRLHARQHGTTRSLLVPHISHLGCSTASALETVTKRSIVHNANPGIAPPPCAWSIQTRQCSAACTPPRAVRPSRWRDQEAARSNRRASPQSRLE
jgi:hypothetical protein